ATKVTTCIYHRSLAEFAPVFTSIRDNSLAASVRLDRRRDPIWITAFAGTACSSIRWSSTGSFRRVSLSPLHNLRPFGPRPIRCCKDSPARSLPKHLRKSRTPSPWADADHGRTRIFSHRRTRINTDKDPCDSVFIRDLLFRVHPWLF